MNALSPIIYPLVGGDIPGDELFRLELHIARRADELAVLHERDQGCDYWETAEREFLPDLLRMSA